MEKYLALVKNNLVQGVIVGSDEFADLIRNDYDYIIDVTNEERPSPGDSYYPNANMFVSNAVTYVELQVDLNADYLQNGTEESFEPFKLSQYSVSLKDGIIQIGCKQYSAAGMFEVLHELLIENQETSSCFSRTETGLTHGKFDITWSDAQQLYDALSRIKFQ